MEKAKARIGLKRNILIRVMGNGQHEKQEISECQIAGPFARALFD
jgi:Ni,Fe-hydrogenase III large subunit